MANIFSKARSLFHLFHSIDIEQISALASKIDLGEVMAAVGKMDDNQLGAVVKMLKGGHHHKDDDQKENIKIKFELILIIIDIKVVKGV